MNHPAEPQQANPHVAMPMEILTPEQLAERLQVKRSWVYEQTCRHPQRRSSAIHKTRAVFAVRLERRARLVGAPETRPELSAMVWAAVEWREITKACQRSGLPVSEFIRTTVNLQKEGK